MQTNRNWLTMAQAAELIGVTRQRMHQIVEEARLQVTQVNPRLTIIDRAVVDKLLAERRKNMRLDT
jgi:DNA-binding XRE family transcriptional regulator